MRGEPKARAVRLRSCRPRRSKQQLPIQSPNQLLQAKFLRQMGDVKVVTEEINLMRSHWRNPPYHLITETDPEVPIAGLHRPMSLQPKGSSIVSPGRFGWMVRRTIVASRVGIDKAGFVSRAATPRPSPVILAFFACKVCAIVRMPCLRRHLPYAKLCGLLSSHMHLHYQS